MQALLILPLICVLALLMSTPIFLHTHLHVPLIDGANSGEVAAAPVAGERSGEDDDYEPHPAVDYWSHLVFCIEDWNYGGEITSHGE